MTAQAAARNKNQFILSAVAVTIKTYIKSYKLKSKQKHA